jgi:Leishmanolysin
VTGLNSAKCPYKGPRANAEYKNISGCEVVPTENDGDPNGGTYCGHWDEECMQSELMTGYLNSGLNPLSRISIATLGDLGYTVDYSIAESYGRGNLNSTCLCNRRTLTESSKHGTTRQLGTSLKSTKRRTLSDVGLQQAIDYGQAVLQQRKEGTASLTFKDGPDESSNDIEYVGDQVVVVFVEEGGAFFDITVTPAL